MIQSYDHPYVFLPDRDRLKITERIHGRAAVFMNLYYEEQTNYYRQYLNVIPEYIDIYVISSKKVILQKLSDKRYKTVLKENRGRDISALLISAKPFINKYDYICFCHDKKEQGPEDIEYIKEWKLNLFQNLIGTEIYIENLLSYIERNEEIGMLVPLPQHGRGRFHYLKGDWGLDYDLTKELIKELGISADLSPDHLPFTFGTMFWAKTTAISKLYAKEWKYDDFPEEPLGYDGTINHAIERVFQYLVEDAGFKVKISVSISYAERFMNILRRELRTFWDIVIDNYGIYFMDQLQKEISVSKKRTNYINSFCGHYNRIYLYGAGKVADSCLKHMSEAGVFPTGIIVTESDKNQLFNRIKVTPIDQFDWGSDAGIIIAVGRKLLPEVTHIVEQHGCKDYMVFIDIDRNIGA